MRFQFIFSSTLATALTFALVPLGCGGVQEEYTVIERPREIEAMHDSREPRQTQPPEHVRRRLKACVDAHSGQWSERSYAIQYDAKANEDGAMLEVKLRDSTLPDEDVEKCLRHVIASMTVPDQALRRNSHGPISGGERMMRERRGPLGDSESQNPLVLLGPFIVEAVGVDVIIEIGVGIIAAIGTIVNTDDDDTKEYCKKRFDACLMTSIASRKDGSVYGETPCEWCRQECNKSGAWPAWVIDTANRKRKCR